MHDITRVQTTILLEDFPSSTEILYLKCCRQQKWSLAVLFLFYFLQTKKFNIVVPGPN